MSDFPISAGELRTQITFQAPTISKDAGGAQKATYANVGTDPTVWSRWVNDHGDELVQSEAMQAQQRATVTVRHRTDIKSTWQIVKDSENWKILSIDPVQDRDRWIVMRVERVKGSA